MTEQEKVNVFHKGRQMWAYVKGTLLIAPKYHGKTHAQWFEEIGMQPNLVNLVTRGFILGDRVFAYRGELMVEDELVRDEALVVVAELEKLITDQRIEKPIRLFCGMKAGRPGDLWSPIVELDRKKGGMPVGS
jgi:hypothetical protein